VSSERKDVSYWAKYPVNATHTMHRPHHHNTHTVSNYKKPGKAISTK